MRIEKEDRKNVYWIKGLTISSIPLPYEKILELENEIKKIKQYKEYLEKNLK